MELLGLTPTMLMLTLAGLAAVVLALYLLKNEQRKVIVPSVLLWDSLLAKRKGVAWARKLRRLLSLLLALLITALLAFAISDPHRLSKTTDRRIVILVDASASMQATDAEPSRLESAKRLARSIVRSLGGQDRALVAQLDAAVTPMSTLTDDRAALQHGIERVKATDLSSDLRVGMAFAIDVLRQSKQPELFIVSDGNLTGIEAAKRLASEHKQLKVHYLKVGESKRNVGIEHFSVRRYPLDKTHTESIVRVRNFGDKPEDAKLRLFAGQALLHEESLTLPAQGVAARTFADLAATGSALEARIELEAGADVLAADDRAYAALPPRKQSRVLLVSEGNRYLEAALLLDEYLDVDEVTPAAYTSARAHDVVIFDNVLPPERPEAPALYLAPTPAQGRFAPFKVKTALDRPFFERVDDEHPLTRALALRDVNVASALALVPEQGDRLVAQTAGGNPLIIEGQREGVRFVALAFDIRQSDLPLRVSFPLFILAAVDRLAGEQTSDAARGLVGEPWRLRVPDGVESAALQHPDGKITQVAVRDHEARLQVAQAGVYSVSAGSTRTLLAANVQAELEGAIAPRDTVIVKAAREEPRVRVSSLGSRLWPWLAVIAGLLLAAEWLSFHRRWTV